MADLQAGAETPKKQVKISEIKALLEQGFDRKQIRQQLGISAIDAARIFQHDKLKGLRKKTAPQVDLIDDEEEASAVGEAPTKKAAAPKKAAVPASTVAEETSSQAGEVVQETSSQNVAEQAPVQAGEAIKEVSTPEDNVDVVDDTTTTKGLW